MKMISIKLTVIIVIIVAAAGLAVAYQFFIIQKQSDDSEMKQITEDNGNRIPSENKIGCPARNAYSSIVDAGGFVTIDTIYNYTPKLIIGQKTPGEIPGLYDFVLKPGSTGHITLVYEFVDTTNTVLGDYSNFYDLIGPQKVYKMSEFPNEWNGTGVILKISDIKTLDESSISVTFYVVTDMSVEEGAYLMRLWQTCPGEILTVGTEPYAGPLPWDKS